MTRPIGEEILLSAATEFRVPGSDGLELYAFRREPEGTPRGVVHIATGIGEHVGRGGYQRLTDALVGAGYAVQGHDHRGQGGSSPSLEAQGQIGGDGWYRLVDDLGVMVGKAHEWYPDLPVVLFAHSMGSFASQQWILDHSAEVAGLVLSGTAELDLLEPALDLSGPIDLSAFNAPWAPGRTGFEWLSRDEHEVDLYVDDPRCGFGFDTDGGREMFVGARALADPDRVAAVRSDLPVYITVGEQDPVNAGLAIVQPLVDRLQAAGVKDVTLKVWPEARHEVLNETNRDEVVADVLAFVERVTG